MPFRALLRRKLRYRDATHDVQKLDAASEDFEPVTDPTATNGDIKDVFIHYRAGAATVQLDEEALKEFLESDSDVPPEGVLVIRADDAGRTDVADQLRFTPRVYR